MANKKWNYGLQQHQRECDKCKELFIEDEVLWFTVSGNIICEVCYGIEPEIENDTRPIELIQK